MGQPKTITNSKRDSGLDVARALCALWVVGFWHLVCYITPPYNAYTPVGQCVTDVFMACFMLISGYVLNRYTFTNIYDVKNFYLKRIVRFYILFMLSSVSLYVANLYIGSPMFYDFSHLILNLLGLTTIFPPHAGMLWFMSMIMLFYILTPFIQYNNKYMMAKSALIMVLFVLWYMTGFQIDKMVFVYFPIYSIGLLTPRPIFDRLRNNIWIFIINILLTPIFVYLSLIPEWGITKIILSILSCLCGSMSIITFSTCLSKTSKHISYLFEFMAYGSLCAYLFHRHFYSIIDSAMNYMGIQVSVYIVLGMYLPIMLIVTYFMQRIYDKILSSITFWYKAEYSQQITYSKR